MGKGTGGSAADRAAQESGVAPASPEGHSLDPHNSTDGEGHPHLSLPLSCTLPLPHFSLGPQGPINTAVQDREALTQRASGEWGPKVSAF